MERREGRRAGRMWCGGEVVRGGKDGEERGKEGRKDVVWRRGGERGEGWRGEREGGQEGCGVEERW